MAESNFRDSDFTKAHFDATNLIKSDFRGAINYLIDPIGNKIRGARFSLPEAQGPLAQLVMLALVKAADALMSKRGVTKAFKSNEVPLVSAPGILANTVE